MFVIIILLFVCILIAGFVGKLVGNKTSGKLTTNQNFLAGIIGFIGVGGIIGLLYWGYINSLSRAEIYSRADNLMNSLLIFSIISAFIGAVLIPYLANKYWKSNILGNSRSIKIYYCPFFILLVAEMS